MVSILFEECVQVLGKNVLVLSKQESDKIFDMFESVAPIYKSGSKIDWRLIDKKVSVQWLDEIIPTVEKLLQHSIEKSIFIFWNNASLPVIKTDLNSAIVYFDDITCIGFETWFYNPHQGYIMEFCNDGLIHIGLVPTMAKQ